MCKDLTNTNLYKHFLSVLFLGVFISACSSNNDDDKGKVSGNTNVTPLTLPKQIAVGSANLQSINSSSLQIQANSILPAAASDPGTDYSTDPVEEYSFTHSGFYLDTVNVVLCWVDHLNATQKVNAGIYKTSLPISTCIPQQGDFYSTLVDFYVESTRVDESSPQYIKVWVESPDFSDPTVTYRSVAEFVIHEGVSDQNPYGHFDFRDVDYSYVNGVWSPESKMNTFSKPSTGNLPRIELVSEYNTIDPVTGTTNKYGSRSIFEITSADLQNGIGRSQYASTYTDSVTGNEITSSTDYTIMFDADHTLVDIANSDAPNQSTQSCESRKDLLSDVWGYNLYQADTGSRVNATDLAGTTLSFNYTHDAVNDRNNKDSSSANPYQGKGYTLSYDGPGLLYGFGYDVVLGLPEVNLEDGTVLSNDSGSYLTKAVQITYVPKKVEMVACQFDLSSLIGDARLDLTTLSVIQAPSNSINDWPAN